MPYSPHTKTEIANIALAHIGNGEISDFDTSSNDGARQCRAHWDLTRDSMLRQHAWNFAIKRIGLVQSSNPVSGYDHAYVLPSDFLRALVLNDTEAWEPSDKYAIEGGLLLTDEDTATIRYVARIEDTSKWDPLFIEAFSLMLAAKICTNLADAPNMGANLRQQAQYLTGVAMQRDANENQKKSPSQAARSKFIVARGRGTRNRPDLSFGDF